MNFKFVYLIFASIGGRVGEMSTHKFFGYSIFGRYGKFSILGGQFENFTSAGTDDNIFVIRGQVNSLDFRVERGFEVIFSDFE